jgi:hypothetical protein
LAHLYVANCTKQDHDFTYRVPAEDAQSWRRIQHQRIPAGSQMRIHSDAPTAVLDAIVAQHAPYGLIPVSEVPSTHAFIGMCYAIDKPVDLERLRYAFDHNAGVLHEEDMARAEEQAVAIDNALEGTIGNPMTALEVEVLEESDQPKTGTAMRLVKNEAPPDVTERRAARRRRAR